MCDLQIRAKELPTLSVTIRVEVRNLNRNIGHWTFAKMKGVSTVVEDCRPTNRVK